MQMNNNCLIPDDKTKDDIYDMFMKKVCKYDEIWINSEPFLININYRITDPTAKEATEKIVPEKEGLFTESPVLEINNVEAFKTALFNYVQAYTSLESRWTRPDISDRWEDIAMYAMSVIWTNATAQDFTNPISFLKKYTDFLTTDQWEDLKEPRDAGQIYGIQLWKKVMESYSERETPHNYTLYIQDEKGKKQYLPSVCYGIQDKKAYVCAIHQIYGKNQTESEEMQDIRRSIKGRGVEPLGIATLISFIEECKKRGIEQIVMPDCFVMQYTTKNRIQERYIDYFRHQSEEKVEQERIKKEEKIDKDFRGSLDNRLMTMLVVSRYYSTGLKLLEIPGDVSGNLTVDIRDYKYGREKKVQEDRRNKNRPHKEVEAEPEESR